MTYTYDFRGFQTSLPWDDTVTLAQTLHAPRPALSTRHTRRLAHIWTARVTERGYPGARSPRIAFASATSAAGLAPLLATGHGVEIYQPTGRRVVGPSAIARVMAENPEAMS